MRVWDVHPAYLNDQNLLGEHRELHAIVAVIEGGKRGYANHPETLRWRGHGWALQMRHAMLVTEMALRGFTDRSPLVSGGKRGTWPPTFIDPPARQFELLRQKYSSRSPGRIPLPDDPHQLWANHKYSCLARDPSRCREIGRGVAEGRLDFSALAQTVTDLLRTPPTSGGVRNAALHMWGHVGSRDVTAHHEINTMPLDRLLRAIQARAQEDASETYVSRSTALSELLAWLPELD